MPQSSLIFIDKLFKPLYWLSKGVKSIVPRKESKNDTFYVIKFFGLGSLTRIAYVVKNSSIDKNVITFITLERNRPIIAYLKMDALYIRTNNPVRFVQDVFSVFI